MAKMLEMLERMVRGEVPPPPVGSLIGFRLAAVEPGRAVFEMEAGQQHHNPMGTVHGGVFCDIADGAMGIAFASTLEEGESFTTIELKMNYLRPVKKARLRAEGRLIKRGRLIGLIECDITSDEGELVAHATSTCMVLRGDHARGR